MPYLNNVFFLLLSIFIVNSLSNGQRNLYPNRTITSSRSIYELVQLRRKVARIAAFANRTRQNVSSNNLLSSWNYTIVPQDGSSLDESKHKLIYSKDIHERLMIERLTVSLVIGGVSVLIVATVCIICIIIRRSPTIPTGTVQRSMSGNTNRTTIPERVPFSQRHFDNRNFQRKERRLPTSI